MRFARVLHVFCTLSSALPVAMMICPRRGLQEPYATCAQLHRATLTELGLVEGAAMMCSTWTWTRTWCSAPAMATRSASMRDLLSGNSSTAGRTQACHSPPIRSLHGTAGSICHGARLRNCAYNPSVHDLASLTGCTPMQHRRVKLWCMCIQRQLSAPASKPFEHAGTCHSLPTTSKMASLL